MINGEEVIVLQEIVTGQTPRGENVVEYATSGIYRAKIAPLSTSEDFNPEKNAVREMISVYLDGWPEIFARDTLILRGSEWAVEGSPARHRHSRTGWKRTILIAQKET